MYYLSITLPLTEFLLCRNIKNLNSIESWDEFWLEDCRFESQLGVREFESHVRCAILQWAIHTTFLGFLLLSIIHNMLSEPFSSANLFVAHCSCKAYLYWFLPAGSTNCWKRRIEFSNLIVHLSISFCNSISFHVTYFDDFLGNMYVKDYYISLKKFTTLSLCNILLYPWSFPLF